MKKLSRSQLQASAAHFDDDLYCRVANLLRETSRGSFEDGLHLLDLEFLLSCAVPPFTTGLFVGVNTLVFPAGIIHQIAISLFALTNLTVVFDIFRQAKKIDALSQKYREAGGTYIYTNEKEYQRFLYPEPKALMEHFRGGKVNILEATASKLEKMTLADIFEALIAFEEQLTLAAKLERSGAVGQVFEEIIEVHREVSSIQDTDMQKEMRAELVKKKKFVARLKGSERRKELIVEILKVKIGPLITELEDLQDAEGRAVAYREDLNKRAKMIREKGLELPPVDEEDVPDSVLWVEGARARIREQLDFMNYFIAEVLPSPDMQIDVVSHYLLEENDQLIDDLDTGFARKASAMLARGRQ